MSDANKPDANGWIEWNGGDCPVQEGILIDIKYEDGDVAQGLISGSGVGVETQEGNRRGCWNWEKSKVCAESNVAAYRIVDMSEEEEKGGMKYDAGKPRVDLVMSGFPRALLAVAEVATFGASKYAEDSWLGVPDALKRYTAAKDRHRLQGAIEQDDPETNLRHAAHEAWNALAVLELQLRAAGESK